MRQISLFILLVSTACSLMAAPPPTAAPVPSPSPAPTVPFSDQPPGSEQNPLILALAPSARPLQEVIEAGNFLAAQIEVATGYKVVAVVPASEADLVRDFGINNADIGVLSPFAYLLASENGQVKAALASARGDQAFYGAQFLAAATSGFAIDFDPLKNENTAEARESLAQFANKKPCWTDETSPSGYVVPSGFLAAEGVTTKAPAFVAGHPTVIRALYAGGICDFGATYVDARDFPGLLDEYPDLMKKVLVVWRIPPIIPYDSVVFAADLPLEMRRVLLRVFVDILSTPDGKAALRKVYGIEALQVVEDSQYEEFRKYVKASGLDLAGLIR
jgi:ABC-type phosphate/phosphonate transport system substrate-binding protein